MSIRKSAVERHKGHKDRILKSIARILYLDGKVAEAQIDLAEALKGWRGLRPRKEVAGLLGISPQYLADLETRRRDVTPKLMDRLLRIFGGR